LSVLAIPTAEVFEPLLGNARYKGAHGGRGSGKSHFFAELCVENCLRKSGTRIVCVREVQRSLKESVKRLVEDKIAALGVSSKFRVMTDQIITPGNGIILFQGMQDHTAESIKSLEGFDVAYVEEAQTLTARSLEFLRPTIRKPGSELWFSWNPRSKHDPVDALLRGRTPPLGSVVVKVNYDTNPFFPADLEAERQHDLNNNADRYAHIWLGEYEPAAIGAYYASQMIAAQRRITVVPHYPGIKVETWWDLGASKQGRTMCVGFVQRVGQELHAIDYVESGGPDQGLPYFAAQLQLRQQRDGYVYGEHVMPHDAGALQIATGETLADTFRKLGFVATVQIMPSDVGPGIDAVRNMLPRMWFDNVKCERWIEALRAYRAEWDDDKMTFKPHPVHDWASHPADMTRVGAMHFPTEWDGKPIKPNTKWVT
jgi:phage terminase large subunit